MNRRKGCVCICFILMTVLYIWGNSLQPTIQSNEQSKRVLEAIEDVFNTPSLDTQEAQHIVRKAAHVAEFALLGLEMALLLIISGKMIWRNLTAILLIGLSSALLDETVQVFTRRGSQVLDVWIDAAGLITGIGVCAMAHALWKSAGRHVRKQHAKGMQVCQYNNEPY